MTNSDLITGALRLLGVLNEVQTASAEQGAHGLEALNQVMAEWESDGIDIQYYEQNDITQETPIPMNARAAVKYFLAFALAPEYGRAVTPEMRETGAKFYNTLVKNTVLDGMRESVTSMPRGEGWYSDYDIERGY